MTARGSATGGNAGAPSTFPAPAKGLHAKLAEVMAEAERIPKNGEYQGQGRFKYVLVGDAADAIRKELGRRSVSMLPSGVEVISEQEHATKSGGTMTTLTIRTTWTLVDGETGETATIQSLGTGADSGDKASPKAQTNAMKYALLMGFLLSTGDDPEQHDSSDRQAPVRDGAETLEMLGNLSKGGKLEKGTASAYQGEWRQSPSGWMIGLRLKLPDRDIPQVIITGAIGSALYLATGGDPAQVIGQHANVKGRLYGVKVPGRQTYYRLVIGEAETDFIATDEWRIPAEPATPPSEPPAGEEARPEAASVPLFSPDEEAAIEAALP